MTKSIYLTIRVFHDISVEFLILVKVRFVGHEVVFVYTVIKLIDRKNDREGLKGIINSPLRLSVRRITSPD
jgi:hypothetical protein